MVAEVVAYKDCWELGDILCIEIMSDKKWVMVYHSEYYDVRKKFVEMDDDAKTETHLTSAAAFVEGGIQEACDDACSICLEEFCESDPSTVTTCKHEFHLQCILEWCQRSSQCPMCWQPISLKDPSSQELLEAVEGERNLRMTPTRNTAIFHHPTLGNFELRHLPVGVNDADIEERIIQHLAAAAAMGRAHIGRREGQRGRPSSHGRPHFLVFTHPSRPPAPGASREDNEPAVITVAGPSLEVPDVTEPSAHISLPPSVQTGPISSSALGSTVTPGNHQGTSSVTRSSVASHPPTNLDRAGPSEFQSFSESLKSKFNAVSMRYRESISKSTRGWKDKLFSRGTSMSELGSDVRREVNAGIASVSRMMERLETRESVRTSHESAIEQRNENREENPIGENNLPAPSCVAGSAAR